GDPGRPGPRRATRPRRRGDAVRRGARVQGPRGRDREASPGGCALAALKDRAVMAAPCALFEGCTRRTGATRAGPAWRTPSGWGCGRRAGGSTEGGVGADASPILPVNRTADSRVAR